MATTNGALTPPSLLPAPTSPSSSPAKRKRTETDAAIPNGAPPATPAKAVNGATHSPQSTLEDILSILKSYDTQPSILAHAITASATRAGSGEAEAKRTKLSPPADSSTITTLVQNGAYQSLEAFAKDVEDATRDILATEGVGELATAPSTPEETRLQSRVLAFRKLSKSLIAREEARRAHMGDKEQSNDTTKEEESPQEQEEPVKAESPESRTVLTVFGSAQGPKQLFSSLQQTRSVAPSGGPSTLDMAVKVILPLRESTLPNIISTTEVYPLPDEVDDKGKANAMIGKIFRAPTHLSQLHPPKLAKPLTTKGNVVTFAPPEVPKRTRKGSHSYANQNLATSHWLGYGGTDMPKDPTSPNEKKKSRQRALSMGEAQQPPSESTLAAVKQAKEDALFRSAYSSFAPSRDDAMAIVPEETKNMVWWQKVGEKRFNEAFPIDPELLGLGELTGAEDSVNEADEEEEAFKEAAEIFETLGTNPFPEAETKSELDKGTEEVLQEISELLETLASHQRIRNSSLATNPRTPVIQNSSLASLAGNPSTPSSDEIDVYQMLKSQLTLMISQLPPYAVAKLNGDQLEELNISRTLIVENRNARGVLEDDQSTRLAKAPVAVPAAPASLTRMVSSGSGSHSHYPPGGTQYNRPTSAMHSGARPVQSTPNYYPQQQSVHRSPSIQYQRSTSGSQVFQPSSSYATPRPSFPATQTYGQQTPRASYTQPPTGQYYSHRPSQPSGFGGATNSQYYSSTPQSQSHNRYSQPAQNGYYQRSQNVAPMYGTTPSSQARTSSPLKAAPVAGQPGYGSRPGYGSGGQMRSTYYPPTQYGNTQPHTPVAPSTPGFTSNAQQMMLERQQASQTQARMAAQNSFNRQGSGTPQPPPNGQYGGQPNGTPMAT